MHCKETKTKTKNMADRFANIFMLCMRRNFIFREPLICYPYYKYIYIYCFVPGHQSNFLLLLAAVYKVKQCFIAIHGRLNNVHNNNMQTEKKRRKNTCSNYQRRIEASTPPPPPPPPPRPPPDPRPSLPKSKKKPWFLVGRHSHRALQACGPCPRCPPFFNRVWLLCRVAKFSFNGFFYPAD